MTFQTKLILHNILYNIDLISGRRFEYYTAYLFKLLGYHIIKVTKMAQDYGTDVILSNRNGIKIGIQCKHINPHDNQDVSYRSVEESISGKAYHKLDKGMVITNHYFSPNAIKGGKRCNIKLLDRKWLITKILYLIKKNLSKQKSNIIQYLSPNIAKDANKADARVFNGADSRATLRINKRIWNNLINSLSSLNQLRVILYLIHNMHKSSNKIRCMRSTIHNELKINDKTILSTYKILRSMDLVKVHLGWSFINPKLLTYGGSEKHTTIYNDYYHSKRKWWKDINGNDEFTALTKRAMRYKIRKARHIRYKQVYKLHKEHYSIRQIAVRVHISKATVDRIVQRDRKLE